MMNSQQAINLLNCLEQRLDDYCELNNEGKAAFRMAITALELFGNAEQLPSAQPEQRWIPCSERLPSENGDYLVTLENGVVKILGYSTTQRTTYPKGFYYIKDGFSWRQMQNPVVAWMPLPEPYKAESEDKE